MNDLPEAKPGNSTEIPIADFLRATQKVVDDEYAFTAAAIGQDRILQEMDEQEIEAEILSRLSDSEYIAYVAEQERRLETGEHDPVPLSVAASIEYIEMLQRAIGRIEGYELMDIRHHHIILASDPEDDSEGSNEFTQLSLNLTEEGLLIPTKQRLSPFTRESLPITPADINIIKQFLAAIQDTPPIAPSFEANSS